MVGAMYSHGLRYVSLSIAFALAFVSGHAAAEAAVVHHVDWRTKSGTPVRVYPASITGTAGNLVVLADSANDAAGTVVRRRLPIKILPSKAVPFLARTMLGGRWLAVQMGLMMGGNWLWQAINGTTSQTPGSETDIPVRMITSADGWTLASATTWQAPHPDDPTKTVTVTNWLPSFKPGAQLIDMHISPAHQPIIEAWTGRAMTQPYGNKWMARPDGSIVFGPVASYRVTASMVPAVSTVRAGEPATAMAVLPSLVAAPEPVPATEVALAIEQALASATAADRALGRELFNMTGRGALADMEVFEIADDGEVTAEEPIPVSPPGATPPTDWLGDGTGELDFHIPSMDVDAFDLFKERQGWLPRGCPAPMVLGEWRGEVLRIEFDWMCSAIAQFIAPFVLICGWLGAIRVFFVGWISP